MFYNPWLPSFSKNTECSGHLAINLILMQIILCKQKYLKIHEGLFVGKFLMIFIPGFPIQRFKDQKINDFQKWKISF